ncbi:MAG: glycosyltransferase [Candidatus Nanopelagicales bacterium]|jgi:glycosyltransferase involved in cell wall biosynthesis|nr:glycosyltransferase [Candidatus Nanopelagicales bacterium]
MTLRIAMVSEHASPLSAIGGADSGGQNVHVEALARSLAARGHAVVVHTRRDDPALPTHVRIAPRVTVHHVDAGPAEPIPKDELLPYMPRFAEVLQASWREVRPDVVHAHFWMSALAATQAATDAALPVAVTFHALGSVKRRHQAQADTSPSTRLATERLLAQRVDCIVATASEEVEELRRMGAPRERIRVVPCGVDTGHFRPDGPQAPRDPAARRLLSLCRLVPRKGVDDAIRALAELPGCELVVAGGPDSAHFDADPEVQRLRRLAVEVGVSDHVQFVGAVARSDVPALIRSADVMLVLPWYEPFGMVPLEAMACGLPVVGSAVGGLRDTVEDGRTGLLVPPRTPSAVALAVRRLLSSPGLRAAMAEQGPRVAVQRFDWARVAQATEAVYGEMLGVTTLPAAATVGDDQDVALASGGAPMATLLADPSSSVVLGRSRTRTRR